MIGDSRTVLAILAACACASLPSVARAADPAPPTPTDTLLTSGLWSNGAIWSKGTPPTASDDVDLNGSHATVDAPVQVHSLNMDGGALFGSIAGATVTIDEGRSLSGGLWALDAGSGSYVNNLDLPTFVDGAAYIHSLSVIPPQLNALPASTDTASLDLGGTSAIEVPTVQFSGGLTVSSGTTLTNHGTLGLTAGVGGGGSLVNDAGATMTITGGPNSNSAVTFNDAIDNHGTLEIGGAVQLRNAPPPSDGLITGFAGTIDVAPGAEIQMNGTANPSAAPAIVLHGGELTGAGRVDGGVENDGGTVSPGGNGHVGILTIGDPGYSDGNFGFVQKSGGVVRVDVRGTQPGTTLDQLQVGGPVSLGGSLYIDSTGYAPAKSVDHEILRTIGASSAPPTGTFAHLTGPGGSLFQPLYAPSSATHSVILRSTGGGGGGGGQAPALAGVAQSHKTWREGTKLAVFSSAGAPVGDRFSFSLNEPARVTLKFTRIVPGRRSNGKCIAATSRNRRRPACKRRIAAGSISFSAHAGADAVVFQGRLSKSRKLALGRYALRIVAQAGGKSSQAKMLRFTIVA